MTSSSNPPRPQKPVPFRKPSQVNKAIEQHVRLARAGKLKQRNVTMGSANAKVAREAGQKFLGRGATVPKDGIKISKSRLRLTRAPKLKRDGSKVMNFDVAKTPLPKDAVSVKANNKLFGGHLRIR